MWMIKVNRSEAFPIIRLENGQGFCRQWSGPKAGLLCRRLGLRAGARPCPKRCVWHLFLLALETETNLGTEMMFQNTQTDLADDYRKPSTHNSIFHKPNISPWETRLRDHGLIPTRPRCAIAKYILGRTLHFTAEELIQELKAAGFRCARGTVYNTLNEFSEQGLLRALYLDAGPVVYDTVTTPHAHIYNVETGEIRDLSIHQDWLQSLPELPSSLCLESIQLVFRVRNRDEDPS